METEYRAWLQCFAGCDEQYELDEVIYRCRRCGGLLEVKHDMDLLSRRKAEEWKDLFAGRWRQTSGPLGSGVLRVESLGHRLGVPDLYVKLCGNTHTGSFKDLGMTVLVSMVKQMRAEGKDVPAVACASTGDTSAALAAYCARAGIQSIVFLPHEKISRSQLIQPIANGALTLALETDFDGCMKLVLQLCSEHNIYLANSMNSLRIEGQKTVSIEIVQQLGWQVPDWVVIPGGNLGNVSALGLGFEMMHALGLTDRMPRICCAQSARANPLYLSYLKDFESFEPQRARKTLASAIQIGNPVSIWKAIETLNNCCGAVEQASEQELVDACALADREGLFCCPHTGVALAALIKLVARGEIEPGDRVVVISTAHGLKFPEFKIAYHQGELDGIESTHANPIVVLQPEFDKVVEAIFRVIGPAT